MDNKNISIEELSKETLAERDRVNRELFEKHASILGHPVNTFIEEAKKIEEISNDIKNMLETEYQDYELIEKVNLLRQVGIIYAKKGDLIYPLLNRKYNIKGASNMLWEVDDEIRDEIKEISKDLNKGEDIKDRLLEVIHRVEDMTEKENVIIYPLSLKNFTEEEWMQIYYEIDEYEKIRDVEYPKWEKAEEQRKDLKTIGGVLAKNYIPSDIDIDKPLTIGSGTMSLRQIGAVLDTIPMELTFIDENEINKYYNDDGEMKLFKRPDMSIGRDVYSCHPPKIEIMVESIIAGFKSGKKDFVEVWGEKGGHTVYIKYIAVRDKEKNYIGTLECVQNMDFAKEYFKKFK